MSDPSVKSTARRADTTSPLSGTTWTGVTTTADEEMRAILGLPGNVYQATTIPTAYYTGTTFRRAKRIPLDDVVHFDRW